MYLCDVTNVATIRGIWTGENSDYLNAILEKNLLN